MSPEMPPGPPELPANGWRTTGPSTGRSRRRLLLGLGCGVVAVLFLGSVGALLLGAQGTAALRGKIEFGAGNDACRIAAPSSNFTTHDEIHVVAHLNREVSPGEVVSVVAIREGGLVDSADKTFGKAGDCTYWILRGDQLLPGGYRLEYRAGSELLAAGEFSLAP